MKSCPAYPIYALILLLAALSVSGCAGRVVTRTEILHTQIDCEPLPYPRRLVLQEVQPENAGDHWRFSHADYLAMRAWVIEIERYLKDVRALTDFVERCVSDYNTTLKAADAPPAPQPSWWKFWK